MLLDPHNEHIAVLPIAIYKLLLAAFGMDSQRPFQVVSTLMYVLSIALVFVWIRRRVGAWLALAAALPLLFFGASWIDLLFPFQLAFSGSMSCGIAALLCLERNDKTGDRAACALLVASLAFSSLGLPFIVGAAVAVGWDADRRRRAFVVLVPAALYAVWWLGWGHRADRSFSIEHLMTLPTYVFDGLASSLSSLLGLATPRNEAASPRSSGAARFSSSPWPARVPDRDPLAASPVSWRCDRDRRFAVGPRGAQRGRASGSVQRPLSVHGRGLLVVRGGRGGRGVRLSRWRPPECCWSPWRRR